MSSHNGTVIDIIIQFDQDLVIQLTMLMPPLNLISLKNCMKFHGICSRDQG